MTYESELKQNVRDLLDPRDSTEFYTEDLARFLYNAMSQWFGPDHEGQCVHKVLVPAIETLIETLLEELE